jgi:hypothetical protein
LPCKNLLELNVCEPRVATEVAKLP